MDTKHYTYLHRRKDTNAVFYIGKGQGRRAYSNRYRNQWWHHIANLHGFDVEILAHWADKDQAYQHEKLLIECFRDLGCKLVNLSNGGEGNDGYKHTAEFKQYISMKLKGRVITPEHAEKLRLANLGKPTGRQTGCCAPFSWTCPHCGKSGKGLTNKHRWHFNNCKYKI